MQGILHNHFKPIIMKKSNINRVLGVVAAFSACAGMAYAAYRAHTVPIRTSCGEVVYYLVDEEASPEDIIDDVQVIDDYFCPDEENQS